MNTLTLAECEALYRSLNDHSWFRGVEIVGDFQLLSPRLDERLRLQEVGLLPCSLDAYPTLKLALQHMVENDPKVARPMPDSQAEFEKAIAENDCMQMAAVLPLLPIAEAELSALHPEILQRACVTEQGTVPLTFFADEVLEALSNGAYA